MHIFMLIAALAAPVPNSPSAEQSAQLRTEIRDKCGFASREALASLPEPQRSEALSCALAIAVQPLNAGMPTRINPSLVATSISAEGTSLRFTFKVEGALAGSFQRDGPALLKEAQEKVCKGPAFARLTAVGAKVVLHFADAAGKDLLETKLDDC